MLGGFILLFVGAGIFDIAGRRAADAAADPLDQLRDRRAARDRARLRRGRPRADAARAARRARADRQPRARRSGSASRACVMAALALGVVAWGEDRYDLAVATTMGLTTLSLMHIVGRARGPRADRDDLQPLHDREPALRAADRRGARAHVPRDGALAAAADLRHGAADELAVGHLPARPDRLPRDRRARQARRPAPRPAPAAPAPATT